MEEIGGEFWTIDISEKEMLFAKKPCYLLSGRTALDFIIQDIKATRPFNKAYLPSYCCHSMVKPFLDNGISVEFYNVGFKNCKYTYDTDFKTQCEVVLIMQYFGYHNEIVKQTIEIFKGLGKTVIEDATHSWFSGNPYSPNSDYVFVSFRKWTGVPCGAVAIKQGDNFVISIPSNINDRYVNVRQEAAQLKKQYINKNMGCKEKFLGLFNQAEDLLDIDYQNYKVLKACESIIENLDVEKIRKARQSNAKYLVGELKKCYEIEVIDIADQDVPLFVPIIVYKGKRDALKQYLIDNNIYCPIHWPITSNHKINDFNLYKNSLSLVCDQRYDLSDIKRIANCINCFYGRVFK